MSACHRAIISFLNYFSSASCAMWPGALPRGPSMFSRLCRKKNSPSLVRRLHISKEEYSTSSEECELYTVLSYFCENMHVINDLLTKSVYCEDSTLCWFWKTCNIQYLLWYNQSLSSYINCIYPIFHLLYSSGINTLSKTIVSIYWSTVKIVPKLKFITF